MPYSIANLRFIDRTCSLLQLIKINLLKYDINKTLYQNIINALSISESSLELKLLNVNGPRVIKVT